MSFPECENCGWCCTQNIHTILKDDPRGEKWRQQSVEFYTVHATEVAENEEEWVFYLPQLCPQYKEGVGCTIYEDRPEICKIFPQEWHEWIEPKCEVMRKKYE